MTRLKVSIHPLVESDVPEIMQIEKTTSRWPESAFINEITQNKLANYFVARRGQLLVGYAGVWLVMDEAHITTLSVHSDYRRRKIAEQLLQHLLTTAIFKGARWATLEVRESNQAAQELYKKYGFTSVGTRKNYYQEDNENAVIMWAGNLRGEVFKERLDKLRQDLESMTGTGPCVES